MEGIIMTVEKFIRILGYIVYTALWSPVIVLGLIVVPIVLAIMLKSVSDAWKVYKISLRSGITHDMNFIKTGVW